MAGVLFLPEFPQGSPAHHWQCLSPLMTVTSFVYWYGRKYSISQILLLVRNSTNIWETFHDQILSHGTGRLIPDQAKIFVDMPLQVLISRLGPVIRFSGSSVLLVYYDPGNVFPSCFFPYLESHYYNYSVRVINVIYFLKMFSHHQFCWRPGYTLGTIRDNNLIK